MSVQINEIKKIAAELSCFFTANKNYLIDLDAQMGDGDLGLTMDKAFKSLNNSLQAYQGEDIGNALLEGAINMAHDAAATMGTLLASGLMTAANNLQGKIDLQATDFFLFWEDVISGIKKRGRAELGDKTILDVLIPANDQFKLELQQGNSFKEALAKAYQTAEEALKQTEQMISKFGRAHYYGEKSRGKKDPGGAVGFLLFKGLHQYFNQ